MDKYILERSEIRVYSGGKKRSYLEQEVSLGLIGPPASLLLAMM